MSKELDEAKSEAESYKKANMDLKKSNKYLQTKSIQMSKELDEAKSEAERYKKANMDLKKSNKYLQTKVDKLQSDLKHKSDVSF